MSSPEEQHFSNEVAAFYRGWNELPVDEGQEPILDCDLVPDSTDLEYQFESLSDVAAAISDLRGRVPDGAPQIIDAKLRASNAFVEASQGEFGFYDLAEQISGVRPSLYPDEELDKQASEIAARFKADGIEWDAAFRPEYEEMRRITEPAELETVTSSLVESANLGIQRFFGVDSEEATFRYAPAPGDQTWNAGTYTEDGDVITEINTGMQVPWTRNELFETLLHEGTHKAQLDLWKQAILDGKSAVGPAEGITTFHTPELTQMELLALFASAVMLEDSGDPSYTLQAMYSIYHMQVKDNLHQMINNGTSEAECMAYAERYLPLEDLSGYKNILPDRRDVLGLRTYYSFYGSALRVGRKILSMKKDAQRQVLGGLMVAPPITVNEIEAKLATA